MILFLHTIVTVTNKYFYQSLSTSFFLEFAGAIFPTLGINILGQSIMSDSVTDLLAQIKQEALNSQPGILPPGRSMRNLIGHTVINISDTNLTKPQTEALQKGLTFCPSPGPPNKSLIWTDFKDFHRRLILRHHFYNDNHLLDNEDQELVHYLAQKGAKNSTSGGQVSKPNQASDETNPIRKSKYKLILQLYIRPPNSLSTPTALFINKYSIIAF